MADWKDTCNLPRTAFSMKANLQTTEPETVARWEAMDLYGKIRAARKGAKTYILHDGPPYANGEIHMGHALNKILKDLVDRGAIGMKAKEGLWKWTDEGIAKEKTRYEKALQAGFQILQNEKK